MVHVGLEKYTRPLLDMAAANVFHTLHGDEPELGIP